MKFIGIQIKPSKIFEMCQYWTRNRALMRKSILGTDDPNNSHVVNHTYGMTEDDEDFFFKEYFRLALNKAENVLRPLQKRLFKYKVLPTDKIKTTMYYNYTQDSVVFYILAEDNQNNESLRALLSRYLQLCVLRDWYWLKNLYEEVQVIELELKATEEQLFNFIYSNYDSKVRIPYNDGFVVNPDYDDEDLSGEFREPEMIGDDIFATEINTVESISIRTGQRYVITYTLFPQDAKDNIKASVHYSGEKSFELSGGLEVLGLQEDLTGESYIELTATDATGNTTASKIITVTVIEESLSIVQVQDKTITEGDDLSVTIEVENNTSTPDDDLKYIWSINGTEVVDSGTVYNISVNKKEFTLTNAVYGQAYEVVVTVKSSYASADMCFNIYIKKGEEQQQGGIFTEEYNDVFE